MFRATRDDSESGLWVRSETGVGEQPLSEGPWGGFPRWSPDGRQVYSAITRDSERNVWVVSLAYRAERQVTDLRERQFVGPGLAIGTEFLYVAWGVSTGDIWVMDVVSEE